MKKLCACLMLLALSVMGAFAESGDASAPESKNILIAYFTWADNTTVADADASIQSALEHYGNMGDKNSGVDAVTSASVLVPGNTAVMAEYIHDFVGGDLFSIQVEEPYPDNYDDTLDRAADELDADARPALKTHVENFDQYDIIFLGMPNWWYSCPMAIKAFVEEYDFTGKTVIPFVAHGTGGISGSVRDMRECLPEDCTVLDPIGVYRPDIAGCKPEIETWLRELNVPFADNNIPALRMTFEDGASIAVTLEDNSASRSLIAQLPLTLTFSDYSGTEKIAYPPEALDVSDAPLSCDPDVGTLAYYAPWGNLCIFYNDFHVSENLVPLGRIESGMEIISALNGDFTLTIEAPEE